jgi:hypothetical protein
MSRALKENETTMQKALVVSEAVEDVGQPRFLLEVQRLI